MQKLRLKVKSIEPNGAVILVAEKTMQANRVHVDAKTGKTLTDKQLAKTKLTRVKTSFENIHPIVRLQLIPLATDKTVYKVGDVFDFSVTPVKS